ncbi:uncharacterized protein KQ657_000320 [Scheffersomyces spartinae]|uniref:Cytochrome P450 n=1 Tax=Scheffersomyces spartinae TaxID=45513 RepID=A0A9P7V9D7_9ASCO|nr:uncharacterized protein KQ657_000320 [Scheffersomyces spartinae]KAG7193637.1 hypothetical protein KQ657_000320 [Scheffersomyces spartinae]
MLLDVIVYLLQHSLQTLFTLLVTFGLYFFVLYPFVFSPLRDIPGPYIHRLSKIPALHYQRVGKWIRRVSDLHEKYGDVVILSPTEISVNGDSKYINDIYIKNFPKSPFYENFRNHGFKDNIFSSLENDRHLGYKKLVMSLYSKSAVFSHKNPTRQNIVNKVRLVVDNIYQSSVTGNQPDYINAKGEENIHSKGFNLQDGGKWFNPSSKTKNLGIDVYPLFASLAMDVVSAFELGVENGSNLLKHPEQRGIVATHALQALMGFWTTLMPRFWNWAASSRIKQASVVIEEWQLAMYDVAEANVPSFCEGQNMTTLEQLKKNGLTGKNAYSFLSDNIFAGHETTAIQLAFLTFELLRPCNFKVQRKLIEELQKTFGKPKGPQDYIEDLETVDSLPYLDLIMLENSRVHTSIPGAEPRIVDRPYYVNVYNKDSKTSKQVGIPVGTTISCLPYGMHRVESVFPNSEHWIPERWMPYEHETPLEYNSRITTQQKYMMPFGKGIRMCLGMNVAQIEMKMAIANIYWHCNSKLCEDWCEITSKENDPVLSTSPVPIGNSAPKNKTDIEKMTMYDLYTTRPLNDECWLEWYENE